MLALLTPVADDTVFPEWIAGTLGVDLAQAPHGQGAGVSLATAPIRYAEIALRVASGTELREWKPWVGFSSAIKQPLLGFAGFLQFFTTTLVGDLEEVTLTVNSLYPGT